MFRLTTGVTVCVLAIALSACSKQTDNQLADQSQPEPVRNLLLICIDTVRADTFFQLGELSPDRLSEWEQDALVFTRAAAPAPWTVPSVASAFTGLWPIQHGAGLIPGMRKISMVKSPPSVLQPGVDTIATVASDNGFTTTVISASQWTFDNENPVDISRGFEDFHEHVPGFGTLGDIFWDSMLEQWNDLITGQPEGTRALNFLHFLEAHNWHTVMPAKLNKFIEGFSPEQLALYREIAPPRACEDEQSIYCKRYVVYAHAVAALRDVIADMLDTLRAQGQLEDTAVVLFSDHGEEFNDHAGDGRELYIPNTQKFLGHGLSLYEEQLHVPLLVWHPGLAGASIETPVSLIDIAPSAANWLGLDFEPPGGEGRLLHEQPARIEDSDYRVLYASHVAESEKQMSARVKTDKAIWYMASDRTSYYELDKDPDELQSAPTDARVLAFDGHFIAYEELKPDKHSESASFTDEQVKRLQSIGYLQGAETGDELQDVDNDDGQAMPAEPESQQ